MSGTERISIILAGEQFGRFQGARVENILSGSTHTAEELETAKKELAHNIERRIRNDDILWVEPGHTPELDEMFKSMGRPYFAMVKWVDGQMHIERVPIFT